MSTNCLIIKAQAVDKSINADIGKAKVYYTGDDIIDEAGIIYRADGSVVYPNGVYMEANGTVHYTDGSVKMPNGITYFVNGVIEYPSGLRVDANGNVLSNVAGSAATTEAAQDEVVQSTTETIASSENIGLSKSNTNDGVWDYDPYTDKWKFKIFDTDGNMIRIYFNCWIQKTNDKGKDSWYAVDENGNMITGFAKYNGDFYYFSQKADSRGELMTGEVIIAGKTYVFDENGVLKKGKISIKRFPVIGKKNYISRVDGYWKIGDEGTKSFLLYKEIPGVLRATEIATGWMLIDGYYYCLDEEGIPITGLTVYDNKYYYMERDGRMLEGGTVNISGKRYTFDKATGACISIE